MSRPTRGVRPGLSLIAAAVLLTVALPALADDPASTTEISAGSAPAAAPQASSDPAGGPAASAPTPAPNASAPVAPVPARPLTPEEQTLKQILDEGQARVAELLAQGEQEPSRMSEIQLEIVKVKTESRVRFLQKLVEFARARGDQREIEEAQAALDLTLHPPVPATQASPSERELNDAKAQEVRR